MGLDLLNPADNRIYLVEGVFKACRFHNWGLNSLATLSNNPKHLVDQLNILGYRIIVVCDGDEAGRKLAKFGHESVMLPDGVYIDDMSTLEFYFLLGEIS